MTVEIILSSIVTSSTLALIATLNGKLFELAMSSHHGLLFIVVVNNYSCNTLGVVFVEEDLSMLEDRGA